VHFLLVIKEPGFPLFKITTLEHFFNTRIFRMGLFATRQPDITSKGVGSTSLLRQDHSCILDDLWLQGTL
jgi:hypothetical protein